MKTKPKPGRPAYEADEKTRAQVKMLAAMGIPDYDIAKVIGISGPTMRKYYMAELETGHIEANAQVAQSLFKQATNKDKPNVVAAIFWLKARAGWRDGDAGAGKKEERHASAAKASAGSKFTPSAPPKLVVSNK